MDVEINVIPKAKGVIIPVSDETIGKEVNPDTGIKHLVCGNSKFTVVDAFKFTREDCLPGALLFVATGVEFTHSSFWGRISPNVETMYLFVCKEA